MNSSSKTLPKVPRLKFLMSIPKLLKNPIEVFSGFFDKNGDTFILDQSDMDVVFTQNAELAEQVFQKNGRNYSKPDKQKKLLSEYLGKGLLTSDGEYWLKQRRLIQPGFKKQNLAHFTRLMQDKIDEFDERLNNLASSNEVFDITHDFMAITFNIIASCISSTKIETEALSRIEFIEVEIMEHIAKTGRLPFLKSWYKLNGEDKRIAELSKEGDQIIYDLIDERKAGKEAHNDILNMLLNIRYEETNEGFSRKQLLDEMKILITAGHETTANALSWTLYLLAQHPEVEARLLEEIATVCGNDKPSLEQLPELEYTKMVLQEGMRLYPPAWITDRVALEDDETEGIKISKGSTVAPFIYGIHRNPKYWDNPEQFIPTRFSKANCKNRTKFSYLPFGGGPRLCIGNNFAMMEMQLILVHFIRHYKWKLVADQKIAYQPLITLRPRYGIKMQIEKREALLISNDNSFPKANQSVKPQTDSKCPFH